MRIIMRCGYVGEKEQQSIPVCMPPPPLKLCGIFTTRILAKITSLYCSIETEVLSDRALSEILYSLRRSAF